MRVHTCCIKIMEMLTNSFYLKFFECTFGKHRIIKIFSNSSTDYLYNLHTLKIPFWNVMNKLNRYFQNSSSYCVFEF